MATIDASLDELTGATIIITATIISTTEVLAHSAPIRNYSRAVGNGYCRDTSEPGLAAFTGGEVAAALDARSSCVLTAVSDHSGLSANRAGLPNAQSWRLIIVWLEVRVLPAPPL